MSYCWAYIGDHVANVAYTRKVKVANQLKFINLTFILYTIQCNLDLTNPLGNGPNLFVKLRAHYTENLDITNFRENDQNVRYIEVIVND